MMCMCAHRWYTCESDDPIVQRRWIPWAGVTGICELSDVGAGDQTQHSGSASLANPHPLNHHSSPLPTLSFIYLFISIYPFVVTFHTYAQYVLVLFASLPLSCSLSHWHWSPSSSQATPGLPFYSPLLPSPVISIGFFFSSRSVGEGVFIRAIKAILVHPLYCWSIRGRAIDASPTGGYAAIIYSQHSDQLWAYGKRSSSDLNWCQHWSMGTNSSLGGNLIGTSCPFSKNNSFPTRACWPPQAQVLIGSVVPDVNFLLCSSLKAVGRPTMGSPRLYLWAYHAWTVDILTHKVHPC